MSSFLFSDNEYDSNQNDVDKNNNLVKKFKSDDDEKNNNVEDVNMVEN